MSLVLNVEILGEFKKLTTATQGAQSDLQTMTKRASSASKAITRSFAAIGVGLSFRFIANELEEAGKAAIEDVKSQTLLANALRNTMNATDDQIASVEEVIGKYQLSASVADDTLRPAYQKLAMATHDTTEANKLLGVALDVAAGTGKNLDVVSQAMAKSLAGSDTALLKLIPSLKGSKTPLEDLAKAFDGAAEKAAATDPYQRMKIVFDELQETVGMALLPTLEKFATWVASPEGQQKLQQFIDLVTGLAGKFEILANWAIENSDALIAWSGVIVGAGIALKIFTTAMSVYNGVSAIMATRNAAAAASNLALSATATTATGAVGGLTASMRALAVAQRAVPWILALWGVSELGAAINSAPVVKETNTILKNKDPMIPSADLFTGQAKSTTTSPRVAETVNINVNSTNATADDIIKKLDDYYKATGVRLSY